MRAYADMDDMPDDAEEYSRVVPLRSGSRGRSATAPGRVRPEPWTPRDWSLPTVTRHDPPPSPLLQPRLTRTHRWMIAAFVVICVGMVLGMLLIRLLDEASRTIAAIPPDAAATRTEATAAAQPVAPQPATAPAPAGTPAISTEIRVLQPNYTVAPGDTLGSIARRHGTSVDALASINNLENRNSLRIGQKLIIP